MKQLPAFIRLIGQVVISLLCAVVLAILGAVIAVYLYDRGTGKGNDLAVALIGFHVVGTFSFVVFLTFLSSRTAYSSWKVPFASLGFCIFVLLFTTIIFSSAYDEYFAVFFVIAWILVAVSGALAIGVCQCILFRARNHHRRNPIGNS